MRYCGSKRAFAKDIIPFLVGAIRNEDTLFVDMCCGGCSIVSEMPHANKLAVDNNPYVIALWKKLQENVLNGFPGDNIPYDITEEQYKSIYQSYLNNDGRWTDFIIGYTGNALSYGGAWFEGYARPNNRGNRIENHCHEAYNGLMKQLANFKHIDTTEFVCASFEDFKSFKENTVIYIDPPYANTKKYASDFPHDKFYDWCRRLADKGIKIFISEYQMPDDFQCIWQKEKKDGMGTTKTGNKQKIKIEKLFTIKN